MLSLHDTLAVRVSVEDIGVIVRGRQTREIDSHHEVAEFRLIQVFDAEPDSELSVTLGLMNQMDGNIWVSGYLQSDNSVIACPYYVCRGKDDRIWINM